MVFALAGDSTMTSRPDRRRVLFEADPLFLDFDLVEAFLFFALTFAIFALGSGLGKLS